MDGEVYSPYLLVLTSVFVSYLMQRYVDSTLLWLLISHVQMRQISNREDFNTIYLC
jgi:hypothetical protein